MTSRSDWDDAVALAMALMEGPFKVDVPAKPPS
jgi:hypothetical protein